MRFSSALDRLALRDGEHARTLARTLQDERPALTGDEARQLVGLLAGLSRSDDKLYVDRAYGETMRRQIYEISEQILGEGDRDTLFAMNELAIMYFVFGPRAVARTMQEQLVALWPRLRERRLPDVSGWDRGIRRAAAAEFPRRGQPRRQGPGTRAV